VTKNFGVPDIQKLDVYVAQGGWQAFGKALDMGREKVVEEVKRSICEAAAARDFPPESSGVFCPKM